jgi:hypothetical protein
MQYEAFSKDHPCLYELCLQLSPCFKINCLFAYYKIWVRNGEQFKTDESVRKRNNAAIGLIMAFSCVETTRNSVRIWICYF